MDYFVKTKNNTITSNDLEIVTAEDLTIAETFILLSAMPLAAQARYDGKLDS